MPKDKLEYWNSKELGEFYYNPDEFKICHSDYLKYVGSETDGSKIKIPQGIKSCNSMFDGCENLITAPSIPEGVKNCNHMFFCCKKRI